MAKKVPTILEAVRGGLSENLGLGNDQDLLYGEGALGYC